MLFGLFGRKAEEVSPVLSAPEQESNIHADAVHVANLKREGLLNDEHARSESALPMKAAFGNGRPGNARASRTSTLGDRASTAASNARHLKRLHSSGLLQMSRPPPGAAGVTMPPPKNCRQDVAVAPAATGSSGSAFYGAAGTDQFARSTTPNISQPNMTWAVTKVVQQKEQQHPPPPVQMRQHRAGSADAAPFRRRSRKQQQSSAPVLAASAPSAALAKSSSGGSSSSKRAAGHGVGAAAAGATTAGAGPSQGLTSCCSGAGSGSGARPASGSPLAAAKHLSSIVATAAAIATSTPTPMASARGGATPLRAASLPSAGTPTSIAKQEQLQEGAPPGHSLAEAERRATTQKLVHNLTRRSAVGITSPPTLEIRHTRDSAAASLFAGMPSGAYSVRGSPSSCGRAHSPMPTATSVHSPEQRMSSGLIDGLASARPLQTSRLESPPGDAKERRYLERLDHLRRMDRSLDGVTHRELFGGSDARLATARALLPWYARAYTPHEPIEAGSSAPAGSGVAAAEPLASPAKAMVHAQASASDAKADPWMDESGVLDAATLAQLRELQAREDQLGASLAAHAASTVVERQRMLDEFSLSKAEQRGHMLDELERVRASMGLLAARAQSPPAQAATRESPVKAMIVAARADPPLYDGLRSGACMGVPLNEQGRIWSF